MSFIKPQLARPLPDGWTPRPGEWAINEKYDGERFCVELGSGPPKGLFTGRAVNAWSRYGRSRDLPTHIHGFLQSVHANIILDGELVVPGGRSYGVKELVNQKKLVFVVFDILEVNGETTTDLTYDERRLLLEQAFKDRCLDPNHNGDEDTLPNDRGCGNLTCFNHRGWSREQAVRLAWSCNVDTLAEVEQARDEVYRRDGEGLILKRRAARYQVGKRSKDWFKIKQLRSQVMTVIGFQASKGQVFDRGRHAVIICQDDAGNVITVKTLNDAEVAKFDQEASTVQPGQPHPAIGRRFMIEFQERTPDGSYRHPRFDHWE